MRRADCTEGTVGRPSAGKTGPAPPRQALPAIQAIVSDLGKVLLPFDVERAWSAVLPHCLPGPEAARVRIAEIYRELRLGCGGASGEEFHRCLVRQTGLRLNLEQFRAAWSDMFWIDHEVVRMIERAPVRRRVLLSNTNELHWSWIREQYAPVFRKFDRLLVSHECGFEKPAPEIYLMAIQETGLPPEAHLFIDDIEENVVGARAVGMDAVLHTDAASLRREFARRGLTTPESARRRTGAPALDGFPSPAAAH
jgi:HAD superfamily hydrolase (TIGR01509 family)